MSKGPSGFGFRSTATQVTEGVDLTGKTILLTGCNSGLGLETLRVLAARGAHIIGAARTEDKARAAGEGVDAFTPVACELSEPSSVRACVDAVKALGRPIDVIIANAGIMALPELNQKYGYELQFFTNHIGHFILITGLLDQLSDDARVVIVSSRAHTNAPRVGIELDNLSGERGYQAWRAYGQSKLANVLFAKELARRFEGTAKTANAPHPGVINTNLGRHLPGAVRAVMPVAAGLFFKNIPQGAATQCYLAAHPDAAKLNGEYFADCNVTRTSTRGRDQALATKLWEASEKIVATL